MKMRNVLSKKSLALLLSLTMCLPAAWGIGVASADSGKVKEFTEDFESYNIASKVAPYQRSNPTDFTGLDGSNNWQTAMAELMDMNGGYRYHSLYGDRLISAANPNDDLDAFKSANPELYNKIYAKGIYNGNAAGVTITIFNYKGEPVSGNLGGIWYGISKDNNPNAMAKGGSIVNNKSWRDLMVESESSGNKYLQFSTYGSTGKASSFGRYDLNLSDTVSVLSQRVYMSAQKAKQFDIRLTSGEPTKTDVRTQGGNIEINSKTYNGAGWTFKDVVSDFMGKKTIVTFDSSNKLLFLGNEVGTYTDATWYTVDLVIYTKSGKSQIGLKVTDASGNVVCTAPLTDDSFVSTASGVMYSHVEPENEVAANVYLDDISLKNVEFADDFESYNNKAMISTTEGDGYLRVRNILTDNADKFDGGEAKYYINFTGGRIVNGAKDGDTEKLYAADTTENKDKYNAFYGSGVYNANAAANTASVFNWKGEPVRGQLGTWYGYDNKPAYSSGVGNLNNTNLHVIDESTANKVMQIKQTTADGKAAVLGKCGLSIVGDYAVLNQKISSKSDVKAKYFGIGLTSGNPTLSRVQVDRSGGYSQTIDGVSCGNQHFVVENAVTDTSFANNKTVVKFKDDGKIYFTTNDTYVADYEKDKWYDVKVLMNVKDNTMALVIRDESGAVVAATDFVTDSNVTLSGVTGFEYRHQAFASGETSETYGTYGSNPAKFWLDDVSFTLPSASGFYGDLGITVDSLAYDAGSKKLTSNGKIISDSAKTAVVIMAVYNKADNSLAGIAVKPNTSLTAGYNPINFEVELDSYSKDDNSVKYFVWDNMNDLEPIYASVEK